MRQPELFAAFDCCAQEHRLILLGRLLLVIEWQCILWECRWYVLSKLVVDLFSHTTEAHFEHQIRLVFCVIRQYPSLLHPQEASQRPEHCSIGRVYSLAYVRSRGAEVTAPTAAAPCLLEPSHAHQHTGVTRAYSLPPPPLGKHGRGPKSPGKKTVQHPPHA